MKNDGMQGKVETVPLDKTEKLIEWKKIKVGRDYKIKKIYLEDRENVNITLLTVDCGKAVKVKNV